jgi:uncharacterized protein (TIGR02118 family)
MNRRSVLKAGVGIAAASLQVPALFGAQQADRGSESPLYKSIGFLKRLPTLTHAQFVRHWVEIHAPLFKPMPGLVKYALNIVDPARSPGVPYDGAAEIWFESEQAFLASRSTPIAAQSAADSKLLLAPSDLMMATREIVIVEPPRGAKRPAVKRIGLVRKRADLSIEEFARGWRNVHAPEYLASTPGIRGYTINVATAPTTSPWAGYASLWWDDQASYDEAARVNKESLAKTPPSKDDIFGGQFMSVLVNERIVV